MEHGIIVFHLAIKLIWEETNHECNLEKKIFLENLLPIM